MWRATSRDLPGSEDPPVHVSFYIPRAFTNAKAANTQARSESIKLWDRARAWANTSASLSERADVKSQQLMRTLAAGGDYTQDTVYAVWQMAISDEAEYVAAYKK